MNSYKNKFANLLAFIRDKIIPTVDHINNIPAKVRLELLVKDTCKNGSFHFPEPKDREPEA